MVSKSCALKTVISGHAIAWLSTEVAPMAPEAGSTGRIAGELSNNQGYTTVHRGGSGILRKRNR